MLLKFHSEAFKGWICLLVLYPETISMAFKPLVHWCTRGFSRYRMVHISSFSEVGEFIYKVLSCLYYRLVHDKWDHYTPYPTIRQYAGWPPLLFLTPLWNWWYCFTKIVKKSGRAVVLETFARMSGFSSNFPRGTRWLYCFAQGLLHSQGSVAIYCSK